MADIYEVSVVRTTVFLITPMYLYVLVLKKYEVEDDFLILLVVIEEQKSRADT